MRRNPKQQHLRVHESGIALISVLWVLLLISTLATTTVYISRTNAILVRRAALVAQAQTAADAAIVNTLSNLSDDQISRHGQIDGSARTWKFDGVDVTVSVTNEATRIDLNAGDDHLVYAFLRSQGIADDDSRALLTDLRQWQQAGDARAEMGTEPTVGASGLHGSNAKRPLQTINELTQIPGWKNQPLDCWRDALTVYTGSVGTSGAGADVMDLAALKWADQHHLGDKQWIQSTSASGWGNTSNSLSGGILRIVARAKLADTVSARAEWVGRLTGNSNSPALTMRWSHTIEERSGRCPAPLI